MARQREGEQQRNSIEAEAPETRERIMAAAEDLLRRHGLAKTTVMDVARSLGMSHANVYRHFASKTALQEAVAERWLARISEPLARIAAGTGSAEEKLSAWVSALIRAKRRKVLDDPELFATYHALAESSRAVVDRHIEELCSQIRTILQQGKDEGVFHIKDLGAAAEIVLNSTTQFHHPYFVSQTSAERPKLEKQAQQTLAVLMAGFRSGAV
jgi:AcrR family transcriptional regulator